MNTRPGDSPHRIALSRLTFTRRGKPGSWVDYTSRDRRLAESHCGLPIWASRPSADGLKGPRGLRQRREHSRQTASTRSITLLVARQIRGALHCNTLAARLAAFRPVHPFFILFHFLFYFSLSSPPRKSQARLFGLQSSLAEPTAKVHSDRNTSTPFINDHNLWSIPML